MAGWGARAIPSQALPALQEGLGGGTPYPDPFRAVPGSQAQLPRSLAGKGLPGKGQGSRVVYILPKIHS